MVVDKSIHIDLYNWKFGFQHPASPIAEGIIKFHDHLFIILCVILGFVLYILSVCISTFSHSQKNLLSERLVHASTLEIIWTIIPALVLVMIAIPSFSLLYSMDEIIEPLYNIKVVGHQWYWSYETRNMLDFLYAMFPRVSSLHDGTVVDYSSSFDSYLLPEEDLLKQTATPALRQLTVDNHLYIPMKIDVNVLVTSNDVLHSWAVPALGIKIDACPGRLNKTSLYIKRPGFYYGQCSEICGTNHGFMPIGIFSDNIIDYLSRSREFKKDFESIIYIIQNTNKLKHVWPYSRYLKTPTSYFTFL